MQMAQFEMSPHQFKRIATLIRSEFGHMMPESKKTMIQCRLRKRLQALGLRGFSDYCDLLEDPIRRRVEWEEFTHLVTTHKTDFMREKQHFDFLRDRGLSELSQRFGLKQGESLYAWSAGCSSGEEPYTLAMTIASWSESRGIHLSPKILCSDISQEMVEFTHTGIYERHLVEPLPDSWKKNYLMQPRNLADPRIRIIPRLRKWLRCYVLNLMDPSYPINQRMHLIFCRNTLIYFPKEVQTQIIQKLTNQLYPGGFLIIGHSEKVTSQNSNLELVGQTVYQKVR